MYAAHMKLDNLVVITDYNKMQIDGTTDEINTLEPLADKWRAFGFEVFEMDGHDWDTVFSTINKAIAVKGKPAMIIAHTVKSKGNVCTEGQVGSHNVKIGDQATYEKFIKGLDTDGVSLPY